MPDDRDEFRTENAPDLFCDDEDESEILTELRKVREDMLVEFPTDEALFGALKAHEAEQIRQGKTVVPPTRPARRSKPNAA
jgi:hypothetical protein